jgi:hypothetical protein
MAKYSRKAWLASIYYSSEKSSTKSFVSITCQLSSVQSCTRKPIRYSPREKRNEDQLKKKKTRICNQNSMQISKLWYIIYHALCTSRNTKKKVYCRSVRCSSQCPSFEPLLSWISGGRSMSATSTCTISLAMSSTENGMLQSEMQFWWGSMCHQVNWDGFSWFKKRGTKTWSHRLARTSWYRRARMDC